MRKIRLGRVRKYSHRKYNSSVVKTEFSSLPLDYQFPLRDVPNAVLNDPDIYHFTSIFTTLSRNNVFHEQWSVIKLSGLFLMLCCFHTTGSTQPTPHKTLIINTDLTWRVIVNNAQVNAGLDEIPNNLVSSTFLKLLKCVDEGQACPGIVDEKLRQLSLSGGRNGYFRTRSGEINAQLDHNSNVIKYIRCEGMVSSERLCNSCKQYKKTLQTMSSNSSNKKTDDRTSSDSHCPWKYLTEEEKQKRIKSCHQQRHQAAKKIKRLEEKLKEVLIFKKYL